MTLSNIVQMNHFPEENRTLDEIRSEEDEIESYLKISNVLEEILEDKKNEPPTKTVFSASKLPQITIKEYLKRIVHYSKAQGSSLILALIYIDLICAENGLILDRRNIHRLLFISVLVAIKFNEDDFYSNNYYSKVGGISLEETNKLEVAFVELIDYRLFVDEEVYRMYRNFILNK